MGPQQYLYHDIGVGQEYGVYPRERDGPGVYGIDGSIGMYYGPWQ